MHIADLPTPCLLLDHRILTANLARMAGVAERLGVALRPHLKTVKSIDIARLAGIERATVSTVAEAEYFAGHGIRDLLYAVGIVPAKLPRLAALQQAGARITLLTDDAAAAAAVAAQAAALGTCFDVLIEIDCGAGRGGLSPDGNALTTLGHTLHAGPGTRLAGVLTHAGHSYACRWAEQLAAVADQERLAAVRAAERLRAAGLPCPVVSIGSTPTALAGRALAGVTELRAGVYMLMDLMQVTVGVCRPEDIAVSVLASVIGRRPERRMLLLDAGALALSKDRGCETFGFGLVMPGGGTVTRLYQEHGVVEGAPDLPVGSRVRVLPNHACLTAAQFDSYHVLGDGDQVVAEWPRLRGW